VRAAGRMPGGRQAGWSTGRSPLCLLADEGRLWVGLVDGGLHRFLGAPGDTFGPGDGLSSGRIYSAFRDREGNLWFGTAAGLERFRDNKVTFLSTREGLAVDHQLVVAATPDGSVWLAGYPRTEVIRFRGGRSETQTLRPHSPADSTRIHTIHAERGGGLWLGGSFHLAREEGGAFSYLPLPEVPATSAVEAVARDAAGHLWASVWSEGRTVLLRSRPGEAGGWTVLQDLGDLLRFRCRILYGDPRGRLWLGFENGEVAVYERGAFQVYTERDGLPGSLVQAVHGDRAGRVWIAGQGGLSRFVEPGPGDHGDRNRRRGRFVTLTRDHGLPASSVSGILEDADGHLWLATALAVFRVHPRELERAAASPSYRVRGLAFDAADGLRGLPRQEEPYPSVARAADGRLWFSTTAGMAVIDPEGWRRNTVPPPVVIETVLAEDRPLAAAADGLRLPSGTRNLEFHYAALSLTDPQRVRFRYKLEGYDEGWQGPVGVREVRYTNLPPGEYRFRVTACNDDGLWNEQGAALAFGILPAFHQTRAFLLLCAAAAGGLVWAGYQWRVRRVTARLDLRYRERLAERTRIAQDLHDTLLQGFLSASMQLHVAADELPEDAPARPRLARVLELMSQVIEEGRNALRGLRSREEDGDDLGQALARIRLELGIPDTVAFRVKVEGPPRPLRPGLRDEVYRIGREALVNAFRHAGAAAVEAEVEYAPRALRLLVRDDGRGIDPEVLRAGRDGHFGLAGMRERAERMGGRLRVWSRAGSGAEVELWVPGEIAFAGAAAKPAGWRGWLRSPRWLRPRSGTERGT
ncbi:MAG TPA: two-component regulator propeller domain-containing protein, partial [Thermoanaerobaculia bacterium]|nr:two-component regulator propeller domain-containing protein [Thermoanaerobaculia bacterium]